MNKLNFRIIWILLCKEWMRLKRNPSALMAVGLLIMMAFLVNIETKNSASNNNVLSVCRVVYSVEDDFIKHLQANLHPKVAVKFLQVNTSLANGGWVNYAKSIHCVAEISEVTKKNGRPSRSITFRHNNEQNKINGLSRWILSSLAAHHSGMNINQSIKPLIHKTRSDNNQSFNLNNAKSKAMVSAMLVFSTQFFVCCALFISLSSNERERGVLQAIALTPASPKQILIAKVIFHLCLSMVASIIIIGILKSRWIFMPTAWLLVTPVLLFSSLGLLGIAALIVSFNKTQTAASLMGFCYLMLVGVVFALSQNFAGFAILKQLMFEHHVISLYGMLFDDTSLSRFEAITNSIKLLVHGAHLLVIAPILLIASNMIWHKKGWRQA